MIETHEIRIFFLQMVVCETYFFHFSHEEETSSSVNHSESDRHSIVSSSHSEEERREQGILVRKTIYSNRENVNLVHEIFRQAFMLPFVRIDKCHEKEKPISPAGVVIKAFSMWLR